MLIILTVSVNGYGLFADTLAVGLLRIQRTLHAIGQYRAAARHHHGYSAQERASDT